MCRGGGIQSPSAAGQSETLFAQLLRVDVLSQHGVP